MPSCTRRPSSARASINGWVERGELVTYCVTDREVFPGLAPLGVMRSEIAPPALPPAAVEAAARAAADAARALGLLRGPCYSQVCLTERGPVLFETAARCGGGFDADVTRLFSGVDLYARLLGVALGDPVLEAQGAVSPRHPAALVRFLAPPRGLVRAVGGLGAARSSPGVVDADVYVRPGDRLEGLANAASRMAHLLVVGDSRDEALARAAAAEVLLQIETAPEGLAREGARGHSWARPTRCQRFVAPGFCQMRSALGRSSRRRGRRPGVSPSMSMSTSSCSRGVASTRRPRRVMMPGRPRWAPP